MSVSITGATNNSSTNIVAFPSPASGIINSILKNLYTYSKRKLKKEESKNSFKRKSKSAL
jgi:hypothetical protein